MKLERIKRIITLARGTDIEEIEYKDRSTQIKLRFEVEGGQGSESRTPEKPSSPGAVEQGGAPQVQTSPSLPPALTESDSSVSISSSMVGRCYLAPLDNDEAEPFVKLGGEVTKEQVVCVIEAMGMKHDIYSNYDGRVTGLFVENGQAVEYGQRLLTLEIG